LAVILRNAQDAAVAAEYRLTCRPAIAAAHFSDMRGRLRYGWHAWRDRIGIGPQPTKNAVTREAMKVGGWRRGRPGESDGFCRAQAGSTKSLQVVLGKASYHDAPLLLTSN
jgi:hypothetical protein